MTQPLDSIALTSTIGGRTYKLEAEAVARYPDNDYFLALLMVSLTRDRTGGRYLNQRQAIMVRSQEGNSGVQPGAGRDHASYLHQFSQVAASIEAEATRAGENGRYAACAELKRFAHRIASELRTLAEKLPSSARQAPYTL